MSHGEARKPVGLPRADCTDRLQGVEEGRQILAAIQGKFPVEDKRRDSIHPASGVFQVAPELVRTVARCEVHPRLPRIHPLGCRERRQQPVIGDVRTAREVRLEEPLDQPALHGRPILPPREGEQPMSTGGVDAQMTTFA